MKVMEEIKFFVNGKPATSGSKRGFYIKKLQRVIITPASKKEAPWKESVKWAAIKAGYSGKVLLGGPVVLTMSFRFARPKSHLRTNGQLSKLGLTKLEHTSKPDSLKLGRAVEDALTGLVWVDDSQVVTHHIRK